MNAQLIPTPDNTFRLVYTDEGEGVKCNFTKALKRSQQLESSGEIHDACDARFQAFQKFMLLISDYEDEIELEWSDRNSQDAMTLIYFSGIDHFLAGDYEMAAAMMELLLELDPEDHLYASQPLAYAYLAIDEYELFDEVINDISDKYPDKTVLLLWSEFRRKGELPSGELHHFKTRMTTYFEEFTASDHPVDEEYLEAIDAERVPEWAVARELWLRTEALWEQFPEFIEALKESR